jgi:hypothetical protein
MGQTQAHFRSAGKKVPAILAPDVVPLVSFEFQYGECAIAIVGRTFFNLFKRRICGSFPEFLFQTFASDIRIVPHETALELCFFYVVCIPCSLTLRVVPLRNNENAGSH